MVALQGVLAKSITASLVGLKGELWLCDHSSPPPGLSIMSFRILCTSSRVSTTAINVQSSTKLVDNSDLPFAISMRSAL